MLKGFIKNLEMRIYMNDMAASRYNYTLQNNAPNERILA